jgi:NAD(P)-dependent dehydrogenase (short-subunit alcohol dehydrogenase family)
MPRRVALITGPTSGIGEGFARRYATDGYDLVLVSRDAERLKALAAELSHQGGRNVEVLSADLADAAARSRVAERLTAGVDVLVNNAGFGTPAPAEDEPMDHFRRTIDVNLTGLFSLTQLVARPMLAAGSGSIVNVASILGLVASSPIKEASYCAAKGAVVNLTRQLGVEWARKGVRVNAIAPGWFPTEMTNEMFEDGASIDFIRRQCPMGRPGATSELDGALLFLAGDASSYVTGHTLTVDGGWVAR